MISVDTADLLALLIILSTSMMGFVAIWAATSPRPWFVRVAAPALPLACLLAVPAYEPIVYFLTQFITVGLGVWGGRVIQRRWNREAMAFETPSRAFRFSLGSLMLATVVVALLMLVAVKLPSHPPRVWANLLLAGGTAGAATLIGYWGVNSPGRRLWRILMAASMSLMVAAPLAYTDTVRIPRVHVRPDVARGQSNRLVLRDLAGDRPWGGGDSKPRDHADKGLANNITRVESRGP